MSDNTTDHNARRFLTYQEWETWLGYAEALKLSASPLKTKLETFFKSASKLNYPDDSSRWEEIHVFYMLWGYAIENALKSVIVKNMNFSNEKTNKLPPDILGHGLKKLSSTAKLDPLYEEHKDLFDKLEESVLWLGRYPTPKTSHQYREAVSQICSSHIRDLEHIYESIVGSLPK